MRGQSAGYNLDDLQSVFGERKARVKHWVQQGRFGKSIASAGAVRIPEQAVARFICQHSTEYSLVKVNQVWIVAVLFAGISRSSRSPLQFSRRQRHQENG